MIVLLLAAAALLLLAVALAAPPVARALRLTRLGPMPSITAGAGGVLCITAALLVGSSGAAVKSGPLHVAIADEIGPGQVSEQITVFLDGRRLGAIRVDRRSPTARLNATVTRTGRHDYRLQTMRQRVGAAPMTITNSGGVQIDGKSDLAVYSSAKGDTYLLPDG